MKNIPTILLFVFVMPTLVYGFSARSSGDIYSLPADVVSGMITSIERKEDNPSQLMVEIEMLPVGERQEANNPSIQREVLLRDSSFVVEEEIKIGDKMEFLSWEGLMGVFDLTRQKTEIIFSDMQTREHVASTHVFEVPESKMQIVTSDLMDSKTIMTILPTGECMEEDPDVCHPQVRVDYIDDKNMIESIILKKGEGFGFQGSKYFTLADAHTYSKNKNNYVVYGRIEILISSNGKNTKKVEAPKYSNMEYFSPSKQYCTSSFDKDTLEVIHSCGLGSFWKRVVKFIDKSGGFGSFSNPEIMC